MNSEKLPKSITPILDAFCLIDDQTLRLVDQMPSTQRRFPPPWTAELTPNCFTVRAAEGQQLGYVYDESETGRRSSAKLLTKMRRGGLRRISPSSRSCCAKPKIIAAQRLRVGIVRKGDQRRKTGAAFRAVPNVTRVVVAPILGPHRRNQVSTALNAMHPVNLLTNVYRFRRQPRKA